MSPHLDWFSAVSYHAMGVLTDMSSARLVIACFPAWAACAMKVWRDSTIIRLGAHGVGPITWHSPSWKNSRDDDSRARQAGLRPSGRRPGRAAGRSL